MNLLIRDVPDIIVQRLDSLAGQRGQSRQAFLLALLEEYDQI